MSQQQVFINFVPQDQAIANRIRERLESEGISCYMLPVVEDLKTHYEVIQQIEAAVSGKGAMVVVLSNHALQDNWIISNVQYGCDLAGRRTILAIYQVEPVDKENPLALYYAQAVVIHAGKKTGDSFSRLVNNVKRILQRTDSPQAFHPRRLSKKGIIWTLGVVASLAVLLGVGGYFWSSITEALITEPQEVATPVVFDDPFSGESVDQGIAIDDRFIPDYVPSGDPQSEAPFRLAPKLIEKRFSFDDPAFENSDVINLSYYLGFLPVSRSDRVIFRQSKGVLQIAAAPPREQKTDSYRFSFPHLVQNGSLDYLGIRFSIEDYQGWSDANHTNNAGFELYNHQFPLGLIDLSQKSIAVSPSGDTEKGTESIKFGPGWHTLEYLPGAQSDHLDIFLDGAKIGESEGIAGINSFVPLSMFLTIEHSTDWINIYIDELVYRSRQAVPVTSDPGNAVYAMKPDEILYKNAFDQPPGADVLVSEQQFIRVSDGKLQFMINPGEGNNLLVGMQIPAKPVSEMNYFAMRYRLTGNQQEFWSNWGNISITLFNPALEQEQQYSIGVEESRYMAEYKYRTAQREIFGWSGSQENFAPGYWHTMEMVIKPLLPGGERFVLQYWHDGCLVGNEVHEIKDVEYYLGDYPITANFSVSSGDHRQQVFAGEIDDITIGFIDFQQAEQVKQP